MALSQRLMVLSQQWLTLISWIFTMMSFNCHNNLTRKAVRHCFSHFMHKVTTTTTKTVNQMYLSQRPQPVNASGQHFLASKYLASFYSVTWMWSPLPNLWCPFYSWVKWGQEASHLRSDRAAPVRGLGAPDLFTESSCLTVGAQPCVMQRLVPRELSVRLSERNALHGPRGILSHSVS